MKIPSLCKISLLLFTLSFIGSSTPTYANTTEALTPPDTEILVREYFKDLPVMIEIARCESKFRQFTDSGSVLRGGSAGGMIGIFQFFESIHAPIATTLGFNLATVEGNLAYAKYLHTAEGTTPWAPAKACWETTQTSTAPTDLHREKLQQQIVLLTKIIALLQKKLAVVV